MNKPIVFQDIELFEDYVEFREVEAQIEIVEDFIKPYDKKKAEKIIKKLKERLSADEPNRRCSSSPREFTVKVSRCNPALDVDYSGITQLLVRKRKR